MTRYSNPLPHNPASNTQGRPAGQHAQPQPQFEQPAWPPQTVNTRAVRPASPYGDLNSYQDAQGGQQPAAGAGHDPYAALRPDGYGYGQPAQPQQPAADPYGLAGYTAPQQTYAQRPAAPQPASSYASGSYGANGYGTNGAYGAAEPSLGGYSQASYGAAPQAAQHGYGSSPAQSGYAASPQTAYANGYAPSHGAPSSYGDQQWGSAGISVDARDYGHQGGYPATSQPQSGNGTAAHWGDDHYGDAHLEPGFGGAAGGQYQVAGQHPAQQAQPGSFDQSYAEDDIPYEEEAPRRRGWKKVVGLVASTILVGGALTIAYGSIMGPSDGKDTPVIKSASGPSKVKPSDPGGKQFAHADSKIMGRLGEGEAEDAGADNGVRKVSVVNVGRDGSIQPPSTTASGPMENETKAVVAVPGLTVIDGLGPNRPAGPASSPPVKMVTSSVDSAPAAVAPVKKTTPPPAAEADEPAAVQTKSVTPPPAKKEKVAALAPPAATAPKATGAGYVAVLASVPASDNSRIDALKQFADMQQKYSGILQNKTPDVQEANLGEKGTYHRLLVGPPGSRDSASSLCAQLKAQGYSGCWVTAY